MAKSHSNIDGFIVRRRSPEQPKRLGIDNLSVPEQFLDTPRLMQRRSQESPLVKADKAAPEVLAPIELSDTGPKIEVPKKHRFGLPSLYHKPPTERTSKRKLIKRIILAILILAIIVGGYFGVKILLAASNVFNGNLLGSIFTQAQPLKEDENGRSNVLIFGTSEDDPSHPGGDLTDSIMVLSINQTENNAFMLSVPRDLWVDYNATCSSGYEGKINSAYQCGKEAGDGSEEDGAAKLQEIIENNFGLTLQYRVHLNYTAVTQAVDAVGGVQVMIDSDDPRGILDRNFDWRCNYKCYFVKWPNGPAQLNGEQALALARARNAAGGYGLGGGNFDREQYQQKILVALKDKALSNGTLANPVAVSNLIDSLGNNVLTNFDAKEIKTLVTLGKDIQPAAIKHLTLVDEEKPLVTPGSYNGQSIVQPILGLYDFSAVQAYLKKNFSSDPALQEDAIIDVLNGSGTPGAAQKQADKLTSQGLTIGLVGNAPVTTGGISIYKNTTDKMPSTRNKLEKIYGVKVTSKTLPAGVSSTANFVIIIGTDGVH